MVCRIDRHLTRDTFAGPSALVPIMYKPNCRLYQETEIAALQLGFFPFFIEVGMDGQLDLLFNEIRICANTHLVHASSD